MATGTIKPSLPITSEVKSLNISYFTGVNLMALDFIVDDSLYYRLALGINNNKEMFFEKNQNGTITRVWSATVR